jgi:ESS family glutamate:Na+ symporter
MNFAWKFFIDLGLISIALLLATALRAKIRFLQKFLIPNALTAGFLLLPLYNFVLPRLGLQTGGLETLIYHMLSLSFISMSLRERKGKVFSRRIISTGMIIITSLTVQGLIGLGLTFFFIATFSPNLFPSFGLFVPLGFELGPGQAFAIGKGWEAFGFEGASSVGLTFAAFGFLWACFGGIFLINLGIRKGWLSAKKAEHLRNRGIRTGVYKKDEEKPVGSRLTTTSDAVESMSINLGMVLGVYLLTFLLLKLITFFLAFAGPQGEELAVNLWGISFIFAALLALPIRKILEKTRIAHVLDDGSLKRISGVSVDLLVTAAIAAISLVIVVKHWIPILTIGVISGIVTMFYVLWLSSRLFKDHNFERALIIYGASTGTMPTGLALLRTIDPGFETPVATDYMYATGIAFFLVIPYILSINLPASGYADGNTMKYWLMIILLAVYLLSVIITLRLLGGKGVFRKPLRMWLKSKEDG